MTIKFRIPPDQISDLAAIRDLGTTALNSVIGHLTRQSVMPLFPSDLRQHIAASLRDSEAAGSLARQLLALNQLIRQRDTKVDDVIAGLRYGIGQLKEWTADQKIQWERIEPQLRSLLACDAIRSVSKATDLAYDHANLFQSARIVTDIRPLFTDPGEDMAITGAVVSYTLRLNYDDRVGDHSMSLALDEADILLLKRQCERALLKARCARDLMNDAASVPTVISGGESDASDGH